MMHIFCCKHLKNIELLVCLVYVLVYLVFQKQLFDFSALESTFCKHVCHEICTNCLPNLCKLQGIYHKKHLQVVYYVAINVEELFVPRLHSCAS